MSVVAWERKEEKRGRMTEDTSDLCGEDVEYVHYLDGDDVSRVYTYVKT